MSVSEFGVLIAAVAVLGMIYPHILYPLILRIIVLLHSKQTRIEVGFEPSIDVCISAYNERDVIERCIASIVAADYPATKLRVIVGDDGSTDDTADRVAQLIKQNRDSAIVLQRFARSGKNAVVNQLIETVTADVVVFTDADTLFDINSIREIVRPLSDPTVGASVGYLIGAEQLINMDVGAHGEASYRVVESSMNAMESDIHSTVASNGSLYAVKRELIRHLTDSRVADDWASLLGVIQQHKRVVAVPGAIVRDLRTVFFAGEVRRTIRTASSGMATVWHYRMLLSPSQGWVSFFLLSHRIVRWAGPLFLILVLVGTVMTVENTVVFGTLFYSQVVLYAAALLGYAGVQFGQRIPIASLCLYFVAMNAAFLIAMGKFVSGRRLDIWNPSEKGVS